MTNRKISKKKQRKSKSKDLCKMQDEKIIAIIKLYSLSEKNKRILATFYFGVPIKEFFH